MLTLTDQRPQSFSSRAILQTQGHRCLVYYRESISIQYSCLPPVPPGNVPWLSGHLMLRLSKFRSESERHASTCLLQIPLGTKCNFSCMFLNEAV
jgi:hypothetical protein